MRPLKNLLASEIIAVVSGVVGVLLAVLAVRDVYTIIRAPEILPEIQQNQLEVLKKQMSDLEHGITNLDNKVEGLLKPSDQSQISAQLTSMEGSIHDLQARFTKIEGLILQDPSKALEIPLMRKDLEAIKESNQLSIAGLRQDLERAYALLVGTLVALGIAVFAPLLSNIFQRKAAS
jgi:chromosome segregation ATPase